MKRNGYFVTGIDTNVGKTVVAAVIAEALRGHYWKPLQCGGLGQSDSHLVASLTRHVPIHPEAYRLEMAAAPMVAAVAEGISIDCRQFFLPDTQGSPIVVEGAGGVMVPISSREVMTDLMIHLDLPVVLVARNYLGSINHTLMSLRLLEQEGVTVSGVVFVGEGQPAVESWIAAYGRVRKISHIPWVDPVTASFVKEQSQKGCWNELL